MTPWRHRLELRQTPPTARHRRRRRRRRAARAVATRPRLPPANIPSAHWSGAERAELRGAGPRGEVPPAAAAQLPPSSRLSW